ncbi:hypothetical protein ACFFIX_08970 [Metabacillus herbersteinensis]|uniref:DUF4203 domain-containing protein n=1 Tax=Metabacillus herbersteinensis TaxID=283816 RepID=A0ABV6GD43_9BACI
MEGILYYWLMWAAWIIATFLLKKSVMRFSCSLFILTNILVSGLFVVVAHFNISISYFLFLMCGFFLAVYKNNYTFGIFITSIALTFAYAGILLIRLYDPVWFIIDSVWIMSFVIGALSIYLGQTVTAQFSYYLIAICQGEFLYWFVLGQFHQHLIIGSTEFLDITVVGCAFIFIWNAYSHVVVMLENNLQKPIKEKQG